MLVLIKIIRLLYWLPYKHSITETYRWLYAYQSFYEPIVMLCLVPEAGLEPARPYGQEILSLQRLPFRHSGILAIFQFIKEHLFCYSHYKYTYFIIIKKKSLKFSLIFFIFICNWVGRSGLEPETPTLKVWYSTNWVSDPSS